MPHIEIAKTSATTGGGILSSSVLISETLARSPFQDEIAHAVNAVRPVAISSHYNSGAYRASIANRFLVAIAGEDTPVPNPNTAVKPARADGTWG